MRACHHATPCFANLQRALDLAIMSDLLVVEEKAERPSTISVILEPELRDQLAQAAQSHERSIGGEVRAAIRRWLDRAETA